MYDYCVNLWLPIKKKKFWNCWLGISNTLSPTYTFTHTFSVDFYLLVLWSPFCPFMALSELILILQLRAYNFLLLLIEVGKLLLLLECLDVYCVYSLIWLQYRACFLVWWSIFYKFWKISILVFYHLGASWYRGGSQLIWIAPSGGRDRPYPHTEDWYPVSFFIFNTSLRIYLGLFLMPFRIRLCKKDTSR